MIAAALFLLPLVALILVLRYVHLDVGTKVGVIAVLATVSVGLPTLWLTWAGYRGPKRSDTPVGGLTMAEVADQLAVAVGKQWADEAAIRRLNDPWPLPVSWTAADASLTDPWDSLVRLAASGVGLSAPPPTVTWAAGPEELAGEGNELADVLARVPTGRLVVIGEPGAGKTMLMVRLVLDLLACRDPGGPVPFLASVASWDPSGEDLQGWLAARLVIDHPALAAPSSADATESTQAGALLASGLILPVLDGLDEIPEQARGPAIGRINDALRPGERLVVTCRSEQYRDAIRPKGGRELKPVAAAAAIKLCPLDLATVHDYLCNDAPGPDTRARWDRVFNRLGKKAPAREVLTTPLMVGLARAIYNSSPGEPSVVRPDPFELRSRALTDRKAVEALLLDAFIPAAYRSNPGRWEAPAAKKWLVFIARHLEYTIASPDLAWWQLPLAPYFGPFSELTVMVMAGTVLAAGLAAGVAGAGVVFGTWAGAALGTWAGVVVGVVVGVLVVVGLGVSAAEWPAGQTARVEVDRPAPAGPGESLKPVGGIRLRPPRRGNIVVVVVVVVWAGAGAGAGAGAMVGVLAGAVLGVLAAVVLGVLAGVWVGVILAKWRAGQTARVEVDRPARAGPGESLKPVRGVGLRPPSRRNIVVGVVVGVLAGFTTGPEFSGPVLAVPAGVVAGAVDWAIHQKGAPLDLRSAASPRAVLAGDRRTGIAFGLVFGIAAGAVLGAMGGATSGIGIGVLAGVGAAAVAGVVTSFGRSAWPSYEIARTWLALRRRLPWSLMDFLHDAHQRGVLRQAGAVYQFRHVELQHRLAKRDEDKQQATSAALPTAGH